MDTPLPLRAFANLCVHTGTLGHVPGSVNSRVSAVLQGVTLDFIIAEKCLPKDARKEKGLASTGL